MLTDTLHTELEHTELQRAHVSALLSALGNPSEWEYTGTVVDAGQSEAKCACGHPIRYCFEIRHATRGQTHVGSTCIDHLAAITPQLGAALTAAREKLEAEIKAAEAAAKRTAADAANAALWNDYATKRDEARRRHAANRAAGRRSPYDLWHFVESWREEWRRNTPPQYVRAADLRRWIERAIKRVDFVLSHTR